MNNSYKTLAFLVLLCCGQQTIAQNFITRWNLATSGSGATQLSFGTATSGTVSYTWQEISPGSASGSGSWSGSTLTITGLPAGAIIRLQIAPTNFQRIINSSGTDRNRLTQVENWGSAAWTSLQSAFAGCANLQVTASDVPNLSGVTDVSYMFSGCGTLNSPTNINSWNTGAVTNMEGMFLGAIAFNQNVGSWNTTSVTNMSYMFYSVTTTSAFNQDIGSWNTGAVTNMTGMFGGASVFNQNIGSWNTGAVTTMSAMFAKTFAFNRNIGSWSTGAVTDMADMFRQASAFNQNIGAWNTAGVTNMDFMFNDATAFNQNIGGWNTSAVGSMRYMFWGAIAFNKNIGTWNTAAVTTMEGMFLQASAFNQNIGQWPLNPGVYLASSMLSNCGMDCNNFSATLIGWNANPTTPNNRTLVASGRQYGTNAVAARTNLTTTKGWTIIGDSPSGSSCVNNEFVTVWNLATAGSGATQLTFGTATSGTVGYAWQEISPGSTTGSGSWSGTILTITGLPAGAIIRLQIAPTNFQRIIVNSETDRNRLTQVENWGSTAWTSMGNAFSSCANLQVTATDVPNLSGVTDMTQMFTGCTALNSPSNINSWNTSSVTKMTSMFYQASAFNQNIGSWNTGAVTNMLEMFTQASAFNQNIGSWNTAAVTTMLYMFKQASAFNQNIGSWNTASVTNMSHMFEQASDFNNGGNGSINNWNTGAVTNMSRMFWQASAFNQTIGSWNTAAVVNMSEMFREASTFNQSIGTWNTGAVTNMARMFNQASAFNNGGNGSIDSWNTAAVTDMSDMFNGASNFNQNIGSWITAAVINMASMFSQATVFNQNIGSWNTGAVTNMSRMFLIASSFNNGGSNSINSWNTGAVTTMINMFQSASAFNQNIGAWNTGAVTSMAQMFQAAGAFNQNIGAWNTAAVTNMGLMFFFASVFNQNIGSWNTGTVTNMSNMFFGATAFNQNISSWNTAAVTVMVGMFNQASAFSQDISLWTLNSGVDLTNMFNQSGMGCNYSATLIGWNANPLTPNGRALGALGMKYVASAISARANLIGAKGWTITGDALSSSPTITSFAPTSGAVGSAINITGTNFSTTPANNIVSFNGTTAVVIASSATTITTTVPAGATTGSITITLGCNSVTSGSNFTVGVPTPTIVNFTPGSGPIGSIVTIVGTNFDPVPGNNVVKFNGTTAIVTASTSTSISTTVPIGATTGTITVTVGSNTATSATAFAVTACPLAPTPVHNQGCQNTTVTLGASGGAAGQYRWYDVVTGGTAFAGVVNNIFTTPTLSVTTSYYVSIDNGTCESTRTVVTATINTLPSAPSTTGATGCASTVITLSASGGAGGQYRWYTVASGGTPLSGEVNSTYSTSVLTTTTYYVAINNGTCESSRTSVSVTVQPCSVNQPPTIASTSVQAPVNGQVAVNLSTVLSDQDNNLDLSTLKVIVQPSSGALASIDAQHDLILDYRGISFSGTEKLTLEVCDVLAACTQKDISIEVVGDITVFNGISPNDDGKNDIFFIEYIDVFEETKKNHVSIYNRWGDLIFETADYNNTTHVFRGLNNNGNEIPSGTYFYKIEFTSGRDSKTGYISLQR